MAAFAALEAVTKGWETGILQDEEYMHLRQRVIKGDPRVIANWSGMASVYEPPSPTITPEIVADLKSNVDELRGMLVRDSSLTPARRKTLHPVAKRSKVVAEDGQLVVTSRARDEGQSSVFQCRKSLQAGSRWKRTGKSG